MEKPALKEQLYQYCFALSAALSGMVAAIWLAWPSSTMQQLEEDGYLTSSQSGTMVALMDVGNVISPIPSAYLMDRIGRKPTLLSSLIAYCIASTSVLFYKNVYLIYFARLMAGLGKGISFAVVPIFLAEVSNVHIRGGLSTIFTGMLYFGGLFSYSIGPYVSYFWLNIATAIVVVIFGLTFTLFPESPYYHLMRGQESAARESLMKFRMISNNDLTGTQRLDTELEGMKNRVVQDMKNKGRIIDLVSTSGNRKALLVIALLAVFQRGSGVSPMLAYSTKTMPKTGGGFPVSTYMIFFSIIQVLANYSALPLVDRWGRKPLLIISSFLTAVTTFIVGLFYLLEHKDYEVVEYNWIPYAGLIVFPITYSIGMGFIPSTFVGELFPLNIKCYASSVAAIMLALTSAVINKTFEVCYTSDVGIYIMYIIFTLMCAASTVFSIFFVFETKGKTFTEIQDMLQAQEKTTSAW